MLVAGDTLHIQSGLGLHLFAMIVGPVTVANRGLGEHYVLVNFSSNKPDDMHDTSCELVQGDHPSIHRPSHVVYRQARIEPVQHIHALLAQGVHKKAAPCSSALLQKIIRGALASPLTSKELKLILKKLGY